MAILCLAGSALASGIGPILQKHGVNKLQRVHALDILIILKLFKYRSYLAGTLLQAAGWVFGLLALRIFPVFLVQSVLAGSIVITALTEKIILKQAFTAAIYLCLASILLGLALLSYVAEPSRAIVSYGALRQGIVVAPPVLFVCGLVATVTRNRWSAILVAFVAGAASGGTALIGRIMSTPSPPWHLLAAPIFWSLIAYGIIGQFFLIHGLKKASGTMINAVMIILGTLAPAIVGILYFNDQVRNSDYGLVIIGSLLIVFGSLLIARFDPYIPQAGEGL